MAQLRKCTIITSPQRMVQSFSAFVTVASLLLCTLFKVPCCQAITKLPLRQARMVETVRAARSDLSADRIQKGRLVRREAPSKEDLNRMESNLNGISGNGYYIDVDIGTPPQTMQLLIDTGSANLAVACENNSNLDHFFHRELSVTFVDEGTSIYVPYTEGEWSGELGTDVVAITSAPNISAKAYVSCITSSKDFYIADANWQGILGLSYAELSRPDATYVPLWDSLISQNSDLEDVFSVQLCGNSFVHSQDEPLMEGSLILGGVDSSMALSDILYTPIYKRWYYEVVLTDMQVDGESLGLDCKELNLDKTIVDSGTTLVRLPSKVFDSVVAAIKAKILTKKVEDYSEPGPDFYDGDTVLCYPDMAQPFNMFPVVSFSLMQSHNSSFTLHLTPQHYLRAVESVELGVEAAGLPPDQVCVKFGFAPSDTGTVLGAVLMEAFYVVFDRALSRVGFAQTSCPLPDPDNPVLDVTLTGPEFTDKSLSECAYKKPEPQRQPFIVASYVLAGVCLVLILPAVFIFFSWSKRASRRAEGYHQEFDE